MDGVVSPMRAFSPLAMPGFGRWAFVGGSVLVHLGAAVLMPDFVSPLADARPAPALVEFTVAPPPPATEPSVVPEAKPEPIPAVTPPAPRPRVARPRPTPARPTPPRAAKAPEPATTKPVIAAAPAPVTAPVVAASTLSEAGTIPVATTVTAPAPAATVPAPSTPVPAVQGPGVNVGQLKRAYLKDLTRALHRQRRYPSLALRERLQGTVLVSITIDAGGRIRDVALRRSSGHALLDRSALAAVRAAPRIPVPPAEMGWGTRAVTLPIAYVLQ